MFGVKSPRVLSQSALESIVEQIADLIGADAIAMLAVDPATAPHGRNLRLIGNFGFQPRGFVGLELENLLSHAATSHHVSTLSNDVVGQLRAGSGGPCLMSTSLHPQDEGVNGAAIVSFPGAPDATPFPDQIVRMLAQLALREIERVQLVEDLEGDLRRARELSARHLDRYERERGALAAEIHDDLSQNVTSIRLALSFVDRRLQAGPRLLGRTEIAEVIKTADQVRDSVQRLSGHFRPVLLDVLGPIPAIRQEASLHQESTGVKVHCDLQEFRVPSPVALAGFRIIQECLSNVARHAQASRVDIRLKETAGVSSFEVEDDGCGFDPSVFSYSLGLLSMIERAELAGGELTIKSRPAKGTRVVAAFPSTQAPVRGDR